jgi:hypothetical protein
MVEDKAERKKPVSFVGSHFPCVILIAQKKSSPCHMLCARIHGQFCRMSDNIKTFVSFLIQLFLWVFCFRMASPFQLYESHRITHADADGGFFT